MFSLSPFHQHTLYLLLLSILIPPLFMQSIMATTFELLPSSLSPYYHIIFTTLAFLISCIIFLISRNNSKSKRLNLPPGPPGWPVVGNLFQVARSGKQFFEYVEEVKAKYGPLFTLRMGTRTMIFICSAEHAHEALVQKGQVFASRPRENPTRNVFSVNKFTVNAALYGAVWRSLRRNMVQNMLSSTKLREFVCLRTSAMDKFISKLKSEAEANEGAVWVLRNARYAIFCVLLEMVFGVEMSEETVQEIDDMMKMVLITLDPRIDDYLPILSPFFSKQRKQAMEVRKKQIETLLPHINKRRDILGNPKDYPNAASFAYLDTLFDLKIEGRNSTPSDVEIVTLCSEFLNGGVDTTGTGIEWAIARLIENPSIQDRLYNEIKSTVGDRRVGEKDVENMPYLQAVIKELLRKHPPTYFSLTHAVIEPAKLGGYDIPTDTNVEIYLPGISEDPKLWPNPENFDPTRFIPSEGGEDVDMMCVTGVKMMPFGAGRRICPGLSMATIHIHLMLARMVQEFEWSAYPENSKMDFSGKLEFTVVMRNTLRAKIKPRL